MNQMSLESNTNCPVCDMLISCVCTECKWWYCPDHILDFKNHVKGGCHYFCSEIDCYEKGSKENDKGICKKHQNIKSAKI